MLSPPCILSYLFSFPLLCISSSPFVYLTMVFIPYLFFPCLTLFPHLPIFFAFVFHLVENTFLLCMFIFSLFPFCLILFHLCSYFRPLSLFYFSSRPSFFPSFFLSVSLSLSLYRFFPLLSLSVYIFLSISLSLYISLSVFNGPETFLPRVSEMVTCYSCQGLGPSGKESGNAPGFSPRRPPQPSPPNILGACAMTNFLDNKSCAFKIVSSWRFPRKTAFWTIFLSAPRPPPLRKRKIYFYCRLAVSDIF